MLKYDTAQGRFDGDIVVEGDNFIIDGKKIRLSAERNPADLKWGDIDASMIKLSPSTTISPSKRPCAVSYLSIYAK
jgi:glyceraldehyde-3-phosphate dehydrogenase/erythrose-4-phosphate dehydrogenase